MLSGAFLLSCGLGIGYFAHNYTHLLMLWFAMGIGYSIAQTPTGRLIKKSAIPKIVQRFCRTIYVFTCLLVNNLPTGRWFSSSFGVMLAFVPMAIISMVAITAAYFLWPKK